MGIIKKLIIDTLFVGGTVSVTYGLYLIFHPLVFIFPGLVAMALAIKSMRQ